jgi:tRNA (guanine37-N1)-methyltransferase
MLYDIITIFPHIFDSYINESLLKRAQKNQLIKIKIHNLRDYAIDKHKTVDDKPYGGGPGMIFKIEPIYKCLQKVKSQRLKVKSKNTSRRVPDKKTKDNRQQTKVILLTPAGKQFDQKMARQLSKMKRLIFICGRYEGIDARVEKLVDEKISIGPYVLSGGESAVLNIIEATARLIPGVIGKKESLFEETFVQKNKQLFTQEYPQYTRPEDFLGQKVPKVLLSGNHEKIKAWRQKKIKRAI